MYLLFHTRLWNRWKGWDVLTSYASVVCARPEVRILAFGFCHSIRQLNRRIRSGCRTFPVERCKGCSNVCAFLWRMGVHAKIAVPHIPVADRILRCVEASVLATWPLALLLIEEAKFNVLIAINYSKAQADLALLDHWSMNVQSTGVMRLRTVTNGYRFLLHHHPHIQSCYNTSIVCNALVYYYLLGIEYFLTSFEGKINFAITACHICTTTIRHVNVFVRRTGSPLCEDEKI